MEITQDSGHDHSTTGPGKKRTSQTLDLHLCYKIVSEGHGVKVQIEFTGVKLTDYSDPLVVLSPVLKSIVQIVAEEPLDMRFDGRVKMTLTTDKGTVVKEGPAHGMMVMAG